MTLALEPLVRRASSFLEAEMDAGTMRRHDPRLLLLAIYSTVIGMVTEVEVLRALGEEPTARSLVRRRTDVLALLRSALVIEDAGGFGRANAPPNAPDIRSLSVRGRLPSPLEESIMLRTRVLGSPVPPKSPSYPRRIPGSGGAG
jgi:hypothetical protein